MECPAISWRLPNAVINHYILQEQLNTGGMPKSAGTSPWRMVEVAGSASDLAICIRPPRRLEST